MIYYVIYYKTKHGLCSKSFKSRLEFKQYLKQLKNQKIIIRDLIGVTDER